MKTTVKVENIKCGGCAYSIRKTLASIDGVSEVDINIKSGEISIDHSEEVTKEQIMAKLLAMGYPEEGTAHGLAALKAGAVSFVSCAVGRINK